MGWCTHSCLMVTCKVYVDLFIGGFSLLISVSISEGCLVYDKIIEEKMIPNLFVGDI